MKICVLHDILNVRGGAERVAITLAKLFKADLFTLSYDREKTFEDAKKINVIEIGRYSFFSKKFLSRFYFLFFLEGILRFRSLNLSDYDVIIVSGRISKFINEKPFILYCHSPLRIVFDLKSFWLRNIQLKYGHLGKSLASYLSKFVRKIDFLGSNKASIIIANSETTRERIRKFYGRKAIVVYPPVNLEKFKCNPVYENFFLSVQRPSPEKRIELLLKVFKKIKKENLVLVGDYFNMQYKLKLEKIVQKLPNVQWFKNVKEKDLVSLYSRCKAVIQTAKNEDFGLVPVEAMACGKPVIAVREGGFVETVIHGKTGILLDKPYSITLLKTIENFDPSKFDPKICRLRAQNFSEEKFFMKMKKIVKFFSKNIF